jgi:hypothetical protein
MTTRTHISRRWLLGGLGAAGVVIWAGGRRYYAPEEGAAYAPWRPAPDEPDPLLALVHAATLAASPHNTQPWRFRLSPGKIELHADPARSLGAMDPLGRERLIGLGCALENLVIAARHRGLGPVVEPVDEAGAPTLVARIGLSPGAPDPQPLAPHLTQRRTHRGRYADPPLSPAQLLALAPSAPVEVRWLATGEEKMVFSELTTDATLAILSDEEMSEASFRWFRQTRAELEQHRDGLTLDAQGLSTLMTIAAKVGPRTRRQTADRFWLASTRDPHQRRASAFGILSTPALEDRAQILATGRAYQRMHLQAAAQGFDMQPLNQAAERRDRERQLGHPSNLGARLAALAGPGREAQMLFRIGRGIGIAHHSPRRPAGDVLL